MKMEKIELGDALAPIFIERDKYRYFNNDIKVIDVGGLKENQIKPTYTFISYRETLSSSFSKSDDWCDAWAKTFEYGRALTNKASLYDSYYKGDIAVFFDDLLASTNGGDMPFLIQVKEAIAGYYSLCEKRRYKRLSKPSFMSLIEIVKYAEVLSSKKLSVYVDPDTGFFGFIVSSKRKRNGILNIMADDDGGLIFSLVANPNKQGSVLKISGHAELNDLVENVKEIERLFGLMR